MDINTIIKYFVKVDDFFKNYSKFNYEKYPSRKRKSKSRLSLSEKVCISLLYHLSGFVAYQLKEKKVKVKWNLPLLKETW